MPINIAEIDKACHVTRGVLRKVLSELKDEKGVVGTVTMWYYLRIIITLI